MNIVLYLLGVTVAAGCFWFMIRRTGIGTGENIGAAIRRHMFRPVTAVTPISVIDDPRTAAVLMAVATAGGPFALSDAQVSELYRVMQNVLQVDYPEEELIFAQWAAQEVPDPNRISWRFSTLWNETLTLEERYELVDLVQTVASAGGSLNNLQVEAIERLRERLALIG